MHAWVKIPDAGKLEPRARFSHFISFDRTSTSYRIYYPDKRQVKIECEVVFNHTCLSQMVTIPEELEIVGEKLKDILQLSTRTAPHHIPPTKAQATETKLKVMISDQTLTTATQTTLTVVTTAADLRHCLLIFPRLLRMTNLVALTASVMNPVFTKH